MKDTLKKVRANKYYEQLCCTYGQVGAAVAPQRGVHVPVLELDVGPHKGRVEHPTQRELAGLG